MPNQGRELSPTRSTALALRDERLLVRQGYEFLDEKRMLLAAEMLRQMGRYQRLYALYLERHVNAVEALARATARHGLGGLWVYPAAELEHTEMDVDRRNFLGVTLLELRLDAYDTATPAPAVNPSPEAARCGAAFRGLLESAAQLASISGNLHRLSHEYRRTERRARALENVLLPEIDQALKLIEDHLEALDREEAVRVRHVHREGGIPRVATL